MRFRAILTYASGAMIIGPGTSPTVADHADLEAAKAAVSRYVGVNKATFQNGYDAFIVDLTTKQVVSSASIPVPTLTWQDNPAR